MKNQLYMEMRIKIIFNPEYIKFINYQFLNIN